MMFLNVFTFMGLHPRAGNRRNKIFDSDHPLPFPPALSSTLVIRIVGMVNGIQESISRCDIAEKQSLFPVRELLQLVSFRRELDYMCAQLMLYKQEVDYCSKNMHYGDQLFASLYYWDQPFPAPVKQGLQAGWWSSDF
jgi:hypothetical protein